MSHSYLLALDLGTSSIGYVAFSISNNGQPDDILDLGVRIFPDGRVPKTKEPLAVARRTARGIRRTRDRGQNRVRRLVKELIAFDLLPADDDERKKVFDTINPYEARALAATVNVDQHTLGRALFHIGRRRGFKSNRLSGDAEETEFKARIANLWEKLGEQTLGQYLFAKSETNRKLADNQEPIKQQPYRFRNGETDFYADRQMYIDEFNQIRKTQANKHLNDEQWDALFETVFWQYPLRPVPKGKCRFYNDETRAHADLPISHQFRILQEVNAMRYTSQGQEFHLDERQRLALYEILNQSKTVTFKGLLKKKDRNKSPYFPSDAIFNLDVSSRNGKLQGNRVLCDLRKPEHLGPLADELEPGLLNDIIHYLIEPIKIVNDREVVIDTEELENWLHKKLPDLKPDQVSALCRYRFKRDTASVSRRFMQEINPVMQSTGMLYSDAVTTVENERGIPFHHSYFETGEVKQELPYYGEVIPEAVWGDHPEIDRNKAANERDNNAFEYGKIGNPTVHVALNQLRVVVNRVIKKQGKAPDKIHIELTRDLKNSKEARKKIDQIQSQNKKNNDRIKDFLQQELGIANPSRYDMQKIKLWEELGKQGPRFCVFSGKPISARQLFNGEVEIEHIIPFSRCYDDGMSNKTLAFKSDNNIKGNRTPHEAFGHDADRYNAIMRRALLSFGQSSKYDRFKEGAFESFYGGEKGDMIERQLNDTKYISRKARQYLSCLCTEHNVISVNGQMTAVLRDVWQLNHFKNRAEGNYREDHRHHIVDAFVVGLTSRSLIQQLSRRRSTTEQNEKDLYQFLKNRVETIPELKQILFEKLDSVVASYKPDHTLTGSMFNDTAYGIEEINGEKWCITRKAVTALSYDEVMRIRDTNHREQLLRHLTGRSDIENKRELQTYFQYDKAFFEKKKGFSDQTGIKKLRINIPNSSVHRIKSAPYKGYALNAYAFCEIWQIPHKHDKNTGKWSHKYTGSFISYAEVQQHKVHPEQFRPHPAGKKLMRIYKHDCLELTDQKSGETNVIRIAGYDRGANKLDVRPNLQAGNPGQSFVAINVLFANKRVRKLRA